MEDRRSSALSLEELESRTGEAAERLREWRSLGLIGGEEPGRFTLEDVERVRLVQFLVRRGVRPEAVARAESEQGGFLRHYVALLFPAGAPRSYSPMEAADLAGLELELLERLRAAGGLSGQTLDEDDVEMLRRAEIALETGFPEEALLQVLRVYGDALGRVAEAEQRLFHFYFHERLRAAGLSRRELWKTSRVAIDRLQDGAERMILYFHRKGMARAVREDMVLHLVDDDAISSEADAPARLRLAIAFVDLSSYTPLTEAMGDLVAAQVVDRFSELARKAADQWEGRVVERIGDAFMLVFPEPRSAVACVLEIERRAAAEPQFPAVRSGVHWGPLLYREGGYVGSTVNVASRVSGQARRHQTLVTAAVRAEASGLEGVEFIPIGKRSLKGVPEDLELFEVRSRDGAATERVIDPVCGMEMGLAEVAARLSLEGEERVFCSEKCLQRFVADPEKYGA